MHTNQRPREKTLVLRQQQETLGLSVSKDERVDGGSWFHCAGTTKARAQVLATVGLGSCNEFKDFGHSTER